MRNHLLLISLAVIGSAGTLVGVDAGGCENSAMHASAPREIRRTLSNGRGDRFQIAPSYYSSKLATSVRYASERSSHKFAGATRVVLDNFDATDKNAAAARLQLDNNDVVFSPFGDQSITAVFYAFFQVKLTRMSDTDPTLGNRCIFAIEMPREHARALGKNSLRLVAQAGPGCRPSGVRLLLTNLHGDVTDTLELWAPGSGSAATRFSVFQ